MYNLICKEKAAAEKLGDQESSLKKAMFGGYAQVPHVHPQAHPQAHPGGYPQSHAPMMHGGAPPQASNLMNGGPFQFYATMEEFHKANPHLAAAKPNASAVRSALVANAMQMPQQPQAPVHLQQAQMQAAPVQVSSQPAQNASASSPPDNPDPTCTWITTSKGQICVGNKFEKQATYEIVSEKGKCLGKTDQYMEVTD